MALHHFHLRPQSRTESPLPVSPLLRDFPSPSTGQHASDLIRQQSTMSRSPSISTFSNNSTLTNNSPSSPTNVHPPPAYVAQFGASQVVSDAKRHFSDDEDDDTTVSSNKTGHGDMDFSPAALVLLNAFLDQLLYSILSVAKSTTLTALRPAVIEVLKARLAGEAIASAEEELQELLAGGEEEEEEMNDRQSKSERQRRWDTELVWKRTRLRVMVYIRLGEMEDDDEERFVREDELFAGSDRRFSQSTGLVSWAAAIFLTSVVEYVAEQVLTVSGQAAASRVRRRSRSLRTSLAAAPGAVSLGGGSTVVEEGDMEKVALSSTLGRLWRTWRKSIRSTPSRPHDQRRTPSLDHDLDHAASPFPSQPGSRDVLADASVAGVRRRNSSGIAPDSVAAVEGPRAMSAMSAVGKDSFEQAPDAERLREHEPEQESRTEPGEELPEAEYPEHVLAANIPIVVVDEQWDVDEIEVPGLARDPDAETSPPMPLPPQRRHSLPTLALLIQTASVAIVPNGGLSSDAPEHESADPVAPEAGIAPRQRSRSEPTPMAKMAVGEKVPAEEVMAEGSTAEGAIADKPEQKANAAEMAAHKRKVSPEKSPEEDSPDDSGAVEAASKQTASEAGLLEEDDDASVKEEKPADESAASADNDQSTTGTAITTAGEHKGLVGGAVAAVSAAAVAAVSLVTGSNEDESAAASAQPAAAEPDEGGGASLDSDRDIVSSLVERESYASLREEPQIMDSKQVSLSSPPTPQRLVRTPTARSSRDSVSFDDGSEEQMPVRPLAMPRHMSTDMDYGELQSEDADIGVAKTSDTAVSTPRAEYPPEVQARDPFTNPAARRPGRLILGAYSPESPSTTWRESPAIERQASGTSPEDFLHKRALSVTTSQQNEKSRQQSRSPNEQTRAPVNVSKRASVPNALVIDNNEKVQPEKIPSPWRQSFSAAVEKNTGWASPRKKASSSTVGEPEVPIQEHPVVQKLATMKNKESKSQEDESGPPLTSANIKGPADFEMFVQGGDTVKYTLTPENVRDDPTFSKTSRILERTVSPVGNEPAPQLDSRTGRSQTAKQTTSSRIFIEPDADVDETMTSRSSRDTKRRSISRPVARNTSVHRRSGLMAREPQVVTESTRDFADFIRSTGPAKEPEVLPIMTHRSSVSIPSIRSQSRPASAGGTSVRSMNRASKPSGSVPPVPPVPSGKSKSNMQPRSATSVADGSSELIDFIRSGPSYPQGEGHEHRISRSVAPFRTTMDSDQLADWGDRLAKQPELKSGADASPSARSASRSSFKSSFRTSSNSKSALLNGSGIADEPYHPAHGSQPPVLSSTLPRSSILPDDNEPIRKRVRSKDPYAIDMFDDDDELFTALPNNKPQEESLMEFLRNSGPSSPTELPGSSNATSSAARGNQPSLPTQRSNQGLKTLGADAVSMGRRGSGPSKDVSQQRNQSAPRNGTTSTAVGPLTKPRSQLEARGNTEGPNGGTLDLADFLRSSGPDATATSARQTSKVAPQPKPERKKSGRLSFFAFFSRSSRNERQGTKQYLDM